MFELRCWTLDIKQGGVGPIVGLARLYALSAGSTAKTTIDRLRAGAARGSVSEETAAELREALATVSLVRLQHQASQVEQGVTPDNRVAPRELPPLARRQRKEAFRAIARAHARWTRASRPGSVIWLRRDRRPWREASFAVLDFETTGLDPTRDHVLSYGLVPVAGGRARMPGALYRVVRPPIPVPPESIRVHGIRPVELDGAPALDEVADELSDALQSQVLVAHAAGIELAFLTRMFASRRERPPDHAIDVIDLAAELMPRERGSRAASRRLSELASAYGVPVVRTHHAFADALITAQLFIALATRLELLGVRRVWDLERAGRSQFARSFVARPS